MTSKSQGCVSRLRSTVRKKPGASFVGASMAMGIATTLLMPSLSAQGSCVASCPQGGGCSGYSGSCGASPDPYNIGEGDHGNDPMCYYDDPDPCRYPTTYCSASMKFDGACCFRQTSPILIDLENQGFRLSAASDGVKFKIFPETGVPYQVAWPIAGSHNGWLVLDRNRNGIIDDASELFGNETPQPNPRPGQDRNGFLALAVFDTPAEGGNSDGWITKEDRVFARLRVWTDDNHDGISQPGELHTLDSVGIAALSVHYTYSKRVDEFGNAFRYVSTIKDDKGGESAKRVYDVLLQIGSSKQPAARDTWPTQVDRPTF